jgi:hypothetical protein
LKQQGNTAFVEDVSESSDYINNSNTLMSAIGMRQRFISLVTHVFVRVEKHKDDHHNVIRRPAHDESNHNHHGDSQRLHLGSVDNTTSVHFGGYMFAPSLHLSLEHLFTFCNVTNVHWVEFKSKNIYNRLS